MAPQRKQQLENMLHQMEHAADVFYAHAQRIDFHQFLEFTGFMREYIKMCREQLEKGVDFVEDDVELRSYEAQYIGDKFGCIFTPSFYRSPGAFKAFLEGAKLHPEHLP